MFGSASLGAYRAKRSASFASAGGLDRAIIQSTT